MAGFIRILKNLGAMLTGRMLMIIQQIIVPPIFIARYSAAGFGEWGVLSGAVAALAMLNFGVQTYMSQDLAVRYSRGDITQYRIRQSTALRLLLGIVLTAMMLCLTVFVLPLDSMLRLDIGRFNTQLTAYFLACQMLLVILQGFFGGMFMSVSMAHRGSHWNNFQTLLSSLGLLVCVILHMPFPVLAGAQLSGMVISIICTVIDIRRTAPEITPTLRYWDRSAVGAILKPSGHFGLIELSTFLTYQAPLVVLNRFLGPEIVASFILMRTIFSMCRQLLAMFTQSMGAEITTLFGKRDWSALTMLYDYSERFIFFLIPLVNTGVLVISPALIQIWMLKSHKSAGLFMAYPYMLAAAISMVVSLKEHKFQFQFSTNTHEELSLIMFGSYAAMSAISFVTVPMFGIAGFLWTWLLVEIFQMVFIVRLNMRLFAEIEPLEFTFLWRLIGICIPSLALSLLLLHKTAGYGLPIQIAIGAGVGTVIGGISWPLFRVREVIRRVSGQFSRRFGQPVAENS